MTNRFPCEKIFLNGSIYEFIIHVANKAGTRYIPRYITGTTESLSQVKNNLSVIFLERFCSEKPATGFSRIDHHRWPLLDVTNQYESMS